MARNTAKKQQVIPGTEPEKDPEIQAIEDEMFIGDGHREDAREHIRNAKESDIRLAADTERLIEAGKIKLPPDAETGKRVPLLRCERDGRTLELRRGWRGADITVKEAKPGTTLHVVGNDDDDDLDDDAEDLLE